MRLCITMQALVAGAKRPRPEESWAEVFVAFLDEAGERMRAGADVAAFCAHCGSAGAVAERHMALHAIAATLGVGGETAGRDLLRGGVLATLRDWLKDAAAAGPFVAPAGSMEAGYLLQIMQVRRPVGDGRWLRVR